MPPLTQQADEFAEGASAPPAGMERREFLRLAGVTAAIAGWGGGCGRPAKSLTPYVVPPDRWTPGAKVFYATAMPWEGYVRGILVETHEGRPTKIEGNPRHRESGGATDAVTQAAIRALYDPDRSGAPVRDGAIVSWNDFETEWLGRWAKLRRDAGEGWAILTEPAAAPTLLAQLAAWRRAFPQARWFQHTPLPRYDRGPARQDWDLERADVILAIGADFLLSHPAALRLARAFAGRRRIEGGALRANRLYAIEPAWTVTGGMADERLAVRPSRIPIILNAIAARMAGRDAPADASRGSFEQNEAEFILKAAADLARAGGSALCVAGPEQPEAVRVWAEGMNAKLGAVGRTVRYGKAVRSDGDPACAGGLAELAEGLRAGSVRAVCVLGGNPVYASSPALEFEAALRRAEFSLHLGEYRDETAEVCQWHLPESHFLEAWGDGRGYDGSLVLQQPLIDPLRGGRSLIEVVGLLTTGLRAEGYELVRAQHRVEDETWRRWLNAGVGEDENDAGPVSAGGSAVARLAEQNAAAGTLEIAIRPEPYLRDGRHANNAWLQELPRPFTAAVWDNALWVAPAWAERAGVTEGDVVRLTAEGRDVEAAILVVPGTADGCAIAELGGGRRRSGETGNGRGFDAYALQGKGDAERWLGRASWAKTGSRMSIVRIQTEFSTEGRDPFHLFQARDLERLPPDESPAISLFPTPTLGSGAAGDAQPHHQWAMLIDLSACLGCSACVAACQAENNIASVGKTQCDRGRHMHWIRVDRYLTEAGRRSTPQPVPCMQCERAPCELVCPVGATVHSSEGLNDMVYNRCVGTRYCSNNCPYKVRRFNFLDYRPPPGSPLHLQENPAVTVRERGVMEKCTYCVQRIDEARIAAEREHRPLRDGEIRTACQQVCPAEAIVFGDLSDPGSAVMRRRREPSHYAMYAELNTRPRTTYLARMVNPSA